MVASDAIQNRSGKKLNAGRTAIQMDGSHPPAKVLSVFDDFVWDLFYQMFDSKFGSALNRELESGRYDDPALTSTPLGAGALIRAVLLDESIHSGDEECWFVRDIFGKFVDPNVTARLVRKFRRVNRRTGRLRLEQLAHRLWAQHRIAFFCDIGGSGSYARFLLREFAGDLPEAAGTAGWYTQNPCEGEDRVYVLYHANTLPEKRAQLAIKAAAAAVGIRTERHDYGDPVRLVFANDLVLPNYAPASTF